MKRVCVIDNSSIIKEAFRLVLINESVSLKTFESLNKADSEELKDSIVFLDAGLVDHDNIELVKELKDSSALFVMVSSFTGLIDDLKAALAGVNFINKPFKSDELLKIISENEPKLKKEKEKEEDKAKEHAEVVEMPFEEQKEEQSEEEGVFKVAMESVSEPSQDPFGLKISWEGLEEDFRVVHGEDSVWNVSIKEVEGIDTSIDEIEEGQKEKQKEDLDVEIDLHTEASETKQTPFSEDETGSYDDKAGLSEDGIEVDIDIPDEELSIEIETKDKELKEVDQYITDQGQQTASNSDLSQDIVEIEDHEDHKMSQEEEPLEEGTSEDIGLLEEDSSEIDKEKIKEDIEVFEGSPVEDDSGIKKDVEDELEIDLPVDNKAVSSVDVEEQESEEKQNWPVEKKEGLIEEEKQDKTIEADSISTKETTENKGVDEESSIESDIEIDIEKTAELDSEMDFEETKEVESENIDEKVTDVKIDISTEVKSEEVELVGEDVEGIKEDWSLEDEDLSARISDEPKKLQEEETKSIDELKEIELSSEGDKSDKEAEVEPKEPLSEEVIGVKEQDSSAESIEKGDEKELFTQDTVTFAESEDKKIDKEVLKKEAERLMFSTTVTESESEKITLVGPTTGLVDEKVVKEVAPDDIHQDYGSRLEEIDSLPIDRETIVKIASDVIEKIAWEVVPKIVERIVKENINKLLEKTTSDDEDK